MNSAEKQEMTLFLVSRWLLLCYIMLVFLHIVIQAEQYMSNFEATHCTPLDKGYFRVPSAGNVAL